MSHHRCYICGSKMSEVVLDMRDMKTKPCNKCEDSVSEVLDSYEKLKELEDESAVDWRFMYFDPEVSAQELEMFKPNNPRKGFD